MTDSAGIRHLPKATSPVVAAKEAEFIPQPSQQLNQVRNVVFKMVNKSRGDILLQLYAQNVTNPKTKKLDTIRVLKGVYTIWESEQQDLKLDPKMIQKSRRSLRFEFMGKDNVALVKADDELMLEALRLLPANVETIGHHKGSRFAFYEINTQKQAEIDAERRANRRKAVRLAEEQTMDNIKKHCVYLGIRVFDEYGSPKVEKALRNEYEDYAELNSDKFLSSVGSKDVEVAYLINKGISDAKIDIVTHPGSAYWSNGGFICKLPSNQKAQKYLIEFAMLVGEENKEFKERLQTIVT